MTKGSLFARILEYRGLVARSQLDQARTRQAQLAKGGNQRDLGTILVALGALTKAQLEEVASGRAAKLRCTKCGSVPDDQRVAVEGWPACPACNGRVDIAPGSSKLQAAAPGSGGERDPIAATIELGLSAADMATMQGKTPDLVVPVSSKPAPADPAPTPGPLGPPRPPKPGDVLGGCRIERKLGQGGMGAVYLATHLMLDKPVALKILDPRLMNTREVIGRFQLEARAAAKLDHENIVRVLNVGAESGLYFMTQEFVKGESLMDVIKRKGALPPKKAAAVIREIARGLAAAHNEGVIHRDIKPGNVMLTAGGKVKVADFGLAKEMHSDAELSHTGQVLGSPHYLSPEQGAGRPVDHRTDLYALGVTYFFLLSGKRPFDGATPIAVIFKHINEAPPKVTKFAPKTPAGHVAIVSKCLKKDPDQRYPDAETLIADLDAVISGRSPKAAEGKGGLSTVRDKPVPKPLTTRYTKEQLESRAEITDQGEAPARRSSKRSGQETRRDEVPARKGPGVVGKLLRFVAALLLLAGLAAGGFWLWKPAEAAEYWAVVRAWTLEATGLETEEDRAKALLAEAEAAAATADRPEVAAEAYAKVKRLYPATVAAVKAGERVKELMELAAWQKAEGEAAELEKQGQFQAARAKFEEFLKTNPGAKQSAEANRRIEALSAALATDLAGREANAHAALGPLRRRVETTADPLHQRVYGELMRELHAIATRYDGAKSAAAAAQLAVELEQRRNKESHAAIKKIEALLSADEQVTDALREAQQLCGTWLDRLGDREGEAEEVRALAAQAEERLEATLQTGKWRERLTKLQELFDRTPGAWTKILEEARTLRAHATDAEVVTEAAKIERITLARLDDLANGTREKVLALARGHADRGDLPAALEVLRGFDMKLFGDTDSAATIRREIERVEAAIERQLSDPLEWVEAEEVELVKRARAEADAAATRYADTPYAERAAELQAKVSAAADARAEAWLQEAAEHEQAGDHAGALAAYRNVSAAGNAEQRAAASAKGVELRGRALLSEIRGHIASRDWPAAAQAAERALVDPSLTSVHPAARALRTHARALGDGMVYVAGALVPRPGGGKTAVAPFYIDRLEVSAGQYKAFVDAGGYRDDRWWPDALGLEARLKRFRDRTGRAGPRIWRAGAPPEGTADHPVRGVTWHEAMAYAKYRGKALPTGQQWVAAAGWDAGARRLRTYPWGDAWEPAKAYAGEENIKSPTMPVDSLPDGASPSGCLHMAGNVREWTADPYDKFKNPNGEKLVMGCGAVSLDPAEEAKVTARHAKSPDSAGEDVGIRLVLPGPAPELLGLDGK